MTGRPTAKPHTHTHSVRRPARARVDSRAIPGTPGCRCRHPSRTPSSSCTRNGQGLPWEEPLLGQPGSNAAPDPHSGRRHRGLQNRAHPLQGPGACQRDSREKPRAGRQRDARLRFQRIARTGIPGAIVALPTWRRGWTRGAGLPSPWPRKTTKNGFAAHSWQRHVVRPQRAHPARLGLLRGLLEANQRRRAERRAHLLPGLHHVQEEHTRAIRKRNSKKLTLREGATL